MTEPWAEYFMVGAAPDNEETANLQMQCTRCSEWLDIDEKGATLLVLMAAANSHACGA